MFSKACSVLYKIEKDNDTKMKSIDEQLPNKVNKADIKPKF